MSLFSTQCNEFIYKLFSKQPERCRKYLYIVSDTNFNHADEIEIKMSTQISPISSLVSQDNEKITKRLTEGISEPETIESFKNVPIEENTASFNKEPAVELILLKGRYVLLAKYLSKNIVCLDYI